MIDRTLILGLVFAIGTLLFILELVRRRRLREEYSLLWLMTALVLLVLSTSRPLLDMLANAIGIFYPPSALFAVALLFVLLILLHFSTVITRLTQENKETAQQIALLRYELAQARRALEQRDDADDERQHQEGRDT
jgi:hypothetical protein